MILHDPPPIPQVLIVEDEAVARRALASLLRANGFEAEVAASAEEALPMVERLSGPAVALVDLDLPGMNGLEFIRRLRRSMPHVIPILVTATSGDRLALCLRTCPVEYIRKPFDFNCLLDLLTRATSWR